MRFKRQRCVIYETLTIRFSQRKACCFTSVPRLHNTHTNDALMVCVSNRCIVNTLNLNIFRWIHRTDTYRIDRHLQCSNPFQRKFPRIVCTIRNKDNTSTLLPFPCCCRLSDSGSNVSERAFRFKRWHRGIVILYQ